MPKRKRKNYNPQKERKLPEAVLIKPVEVTLNETKGDTAKLIKKFVKLCRKEEVLKPCFDKMYHKTKGQKKREKHLKAVYEQKKRINC